MPAPVHRLRKREIIELSKGHCKHGHSYLDHYECWLKEQPDKQERVGFIDIETTNLDANFGMMLSYCIKEQGKKKIHEALITRADMDDAPAGKEDRRIVESCIRDLAKFDRIVTYYGRRFDVPFIRTRALSCGVGFPHYSTLVHDDLYFVVRNRFKLSSNRLEMACRVLLGDTNKTRLEPSLWRAAGRGDKKSLAYIIDHNRKDVIDLERLYDKIMDFAAKRDTSI